MTGFFNLCWLYYRQVYRRTDLGWAWRCIHFRGGMGVHSIYEYFGSIPVRGGRPRKRAKEDAMWIFCTAHEVLFCM